jgi:hypothetical protein
MAADLALGEDRIAGDGTVRNFVCGAGLTIMP